MSGGERIFTLLIAIVLIAVVVFRMPPRHLVPDQLADTPPKDVKKEFDPWQAQTVDDTDCGPSYLMYNTPPWRGKPPIGNVLPMAGLPYCNAKCAVG